MKKLVLVFVAIILLMANIGYSHSTVNAISNTQTISLNDSISKVDELVNQAQTVKESSFEVSDKTKHELVLELNKKLQTNKKYNVNIVKENNPSNYSILGMVLPNGEIQYSLSVDSISTNEKGIVNNVEFINFTFNKKLMLNNVYEVKGTLDENNNIHSKLWINDKLSNNINTNIDKLIKDNKTEEIGNQIAEEQMDQISENKQIENQEFSGSGLAKRWSCTQSCVASKGVSLMVIGIMAGICGAVCNPAALAGLAGGACYACVNSTGILGFSTVMKCWNKCPY